jgi:hypothetical protein
MTRPNAVTTAVHPLNDEFVLHGRRLRPGIALEDAARFQEDLRSLRPALLQQQQPLLVLNFQHIPARYRLAAKELCYTMLSRARGFVTWAVRGGHARSIEIARFKNEPTREVFSDHDRRWALARRLLTEDTVALTDRVAGLLVLLYAQRVTKITRLTTDQVTHTDHGVEILLGGQPVAVPSAFGDLISNLIADLPDNTVNGPADGAWLFPGSRRGQPLWPKVLLRRLAGLGIPATIGRNSALIELAAEMPAAVISGLLGISIDRLTRWTQDAGNTRSGYAAALSRRKQLP